MASSKKKQTQQYKKGEKTVDKKVVLSAKDLSKTFSNGSVQQHVLKNLDLDIYKGDFTVVMGNSGSGKSTLLYALSGMDRPSIGSIKYYVGDANASPADAMEISGYSNDKLARFRRDHVGFVFQQNYLNDSMSAMDNVMICGLLKHADRKELANKTRELFSRVQITEADANKFPAQLSGGQQQRVAVVRGVIKGRDRQGHREGPRHRSRGRADRSIKLTEHQKRT